MFSSLEGNINKPVARVQDPFPWPVVSHNNNKQWHPLPLNRIAWETVKIASGRRRHPPDWIANNHHYHPDVSHWCPRVLWECHLPQSLQLNMIHPSISILVCIPSVPTFQLAWTLHPGTGPHDDSWLVNRQRNSGLCIYYNPYNRVRSRSHMIS